MIAPITTGNKLVRLKHNTKAARAFWMLIEHDPDFLLQPTAELLNSKLDKRWSFRGFVVHTLKKPLTA